MYSSSQNHQQSDNNNNNNNAPSSSIPSSWIEAEENISTLVAAMITALQSSGNNQNYTNNSNNNNINNKQLIEEIPSPQDTIGFMRSAVNILLQLWPEQSGKNLQDEDNDEQEQQQEILAYQSVQHVLFDASHELLRILWMFVVPPRNPWLSSNMNATTNHQQTSTSTSSSLLSSTDVKAAAFRAIKSIAILCARDSSGSLGFMFKDIVRGERGIHCITRCLCSAASTTEARSAAGELLLVLTLQLGMTEVKLPSGNNNNLESATSSRQNFNFAAASSSTNSDVIDINLLVSTTLAEPDANVRSYVLAAVQACIVNATSSNETSSSSSSPSYIIASLCSPSIVNSLLRLVSADDTSDVRCVAALAVQALMSAIPFIVLTTSSPSRQRQSSSQKGSASSPPIISLSATDYLAVAESSIGRLYALLSPVTISYDFHKIDNHNDNNNNSNSAIEEEIVSLLQLLESVVVAAAAVGNEQVFVALRQRSVARTIILRMNLGNRSATNSSQSVVAAAIRCIRVMLELSPPFASQTLQLCDSTSMAALFKLVLALPTFAGGRSSNNNNNASSSHVELQLVLGHILCFSAENRAFAVREMSTKTINAFSGILRERCAMHISPSAVVGAYYSLPLTGIELRDENHSLLNDETLSSLRFETTNLSIDEDSARMILDGQQLRSLPTISNNNSPSSNRNNSNNRVEVTEHWRSCNVNKLLTGFMLSSRGGSNSNIATVEQQQQKRVAILIGLVRFSVQSVLQAVIDLNESNVRNQQQYLNHENSNGDSFMSQNSNNNINLTSTASSNNRNKLSSVGVLFDGNNNENGNNNNNAKNFSSSFDPNDKLISDNSPIDQISSQDREYYDKYKFSRRQNQETNNSIGNPSGSAKRFLQGNANLSPSNNMSENNNSTTVSSIKQQQHQAERVLHQVNTSLYSEFDACVRLVLAFAEHFKDDDSIANNKSSPTQLQQNRPTKSSSFSKDPRQPHLMLRNNADTKNKHSNASLAAAALRLRNPWDVKRVQYYDPKAWAIDAVQEGDLFYFSVQVASLNANVLEAIVAKARAHYVEIRKHLAVTPQAALNRRHFLTEMVTAVMPNVIALLQKLQRVVATQGEGHVQTALALNPELQQQQQQQTSMSHNHNHNNNNNNVTIDCGNVVPVVEFLLQYFSAKLYSMGISSSSKMLKRGGSRDNQNNNNNNNQDQQQHQDVDEILASLGRKNSSDDAFDDF